MNTLELPSQKSLAASILGKLGRGVQKTLTDEERDRRRQQIYAINQRRAKRLAERKKRKAELLVGLPTHS